MREFRNRSTAAMRRSVIIMRVSRSLSYVPSSTALSYRSTRTGSIKLPHLPRFEIEAHRLFHFCLSVGFWRIAGSTAPTGLKSKALLIKKFDLSPFVRIFFPGNPKIVSHIDHRLAACRTSRICLGRVLEREATTKADEMSLVAVPAVFGR